MLQLNPMQSRAVTSYQSTLCTVYYSVSRCRIKSTSLCIGIFRFLSPFFHHFNEAPYHFKVAIGADGAPFGKDYEATAWRLSFINVGEWIASHDENFLLARENCSESRVVMKLYAKKLVSDIAYVESRRYTVAGYPVQFKLKLVASYIVVGHICWWVE